MNHHKIQKAIRIAELSGTNVILTSPELRALLEENAALRKERDKLRAEINDIKAQLEDWAGWSNELP